MTYNSRDDGAALLDEVYEFLGRFVAYPSEEAHVAHVLWITHAHLMSAWESTPRMAFLSPEPGSGNTRALEITELLVPRPVEAVNVTPAYLFRKVGDEAGPPTILFDEIDTIFGPRAKDNEEIRGLLNAGHRRGAVAGRCVVKGKVVVTEEIPAFCAVALAGTRRPTRHDPDPQRDHPNAAALPRRTSRGLSTPSSISWKVPESTSAWRAGPSASLAMLAKPGRLCRTASEIVTPMFGNRSWPWLMQPAGVGQIGLV